MSPPPAPNDCRTQDLLRSPHSSPDSDRQRAEQYQQFANASAIHSSLGRFREADDAAGRASSLYPSDPTLLFIRAQTAVVELQYDFAEELLQATLASRQTDAGWYNLGCSTSPSTACRRPWGHCSGRRVFRAKTPSVSPDRADSVGGAAARGCAQHLCGGRASQSVCRK